MRLTTGEWLWLARRQAGLTQQAAAERFGVAPETLRAWEQDAGGAPTLTEVRRVYGRRPAPELRLGDWLALARRRKGWTLDEAARHVGVSRVTLHKAEAGRTGGAGRIARWWGAEGYPAPAGEAPHRIRAPGREAAAGH